ncbi:MAG: hypothetical protein RLZZ210_943 [Pseudomonadota bacterium]|jgi:NAD(P)H dehydrogenase (quinone)
MSDKKTVVVAYYSGYGHTKRQAQAILAGVEKGGCNAILLDVAKVTSHDDDAWETLDKADGIIFGSPTYMGSVAADFKRFADLSSKKWFTQSWKNKVAGGFTNSASMNGDKYSTIQYLWTFSMQHSMIWVGTGLQSSNTTTAKRDDINYLGGYGGALATSPSNGDAENHPTQGDLDTASLYGERIAQITQSLQILSI